MLCGMWLPKNLALLYKLNLAMGFWIPLSDVTVPRKCLAWEIIFTLLLVFNLIVTCHSIITKPFFENTNIGKSIITFVMIVSLLVKSSYLIVGRKRLKKIMLQIEIFSRHPYLGGIHEYSRVCAIIKKIIIAHLIGYFLCYASLSFYFSMFVYTKSLSVEFNQTLSGNDTVVNKLIPVDSYSLARSFLRIMNTSISLAIPVKNLAIDNLMYLCHFSIECALNALRRSYENRASKFRKIQISRNTFFDEWVFFHVKLKRFEILLLMPTLSKACLSRFTTEVSSFFSVQVLCTITGCIINLCFTVFTAAKVCVQTELCMVYIIKV
jgi:hypothetical protein